MACMWRVGVVRPGGSGARMTRWVGLIVLLVGVWLAMAGVLTGGAQPLQVEEVQSPDEGTEGPLGESGDRWEGIDQEHSSPQESGSQDPSGEESTQGDETSAQDAQEADESMEPARSDDERAGWSEGDDTGSEGGDFFPVVDPDRCMGLLALLVDGCRGMDDARSSGPALESFPGGPTDGEEESSPSVTKAAVEEHRRAFVWAGGISLAALFSALVYWLFNLLVLGRGFVAAGWRLDRERVLDHPLRREIMERLQKRPGATVQELADLLGVQNARAGYHVSILRREEVVSHRMIDGRKHYFLASAPVVDEQRVRKRTLVRPGKAPGRVLSFLSASPGATVSQVARSLGFSTGHAHYHLSKLAGEGLLDRVRRGRYVRHYLTGLAREVLSEDVVVMDKGPVLQGSGGVTAG